MSFTIRVLLVDDDPLVRSALKMMLAAAPAIAVVGEAGDGRAAQSVADACLPHVVLMDIRMPELDGVAATRLLRARPDLADIARFRRMADHVALRCPAFRKGLARERPRQFIPQGLALFTQFHRIHVAGGTDREVLGLGQ